MRIVSLVVLAGFGTAAGANAQAPVPIESTALFRSAVVMALDSACRAKPDSVPHVNCGAINAFVGDPLRSAVPSAQELEAAYADPANARAFATGRFREFGFVRGAATVATPDVGSAIITGLTDFLIARAQEEVVASFLGDLQGLFTKNAILPKLFPSTWVVVQHLDALGYRTVLAAMRAALDSDLAALPAHLASADGLGRDAHNERLRAAAAFAKPVLASTAGASPLGALGDLASLDGTAIPDTQLRDALNLIGRIAGELRAAWQLAPDAMAFDGWLSWLGQSKNRGVFLALALHDTGPQLTAFQSDPELPGRVFVRLLELRQVIEGERDKDVRGTQPSQRAADVLAAEVRVLREVEPFLRADAAADVAPALALASTFSSAQASRDWGPFIVELLKAVPNLDPTVARLVVLGAALGSAQTSAQVTDALTAAADPVGSFRARRQGGAVTWAIVSYLGGQGGLEWLRDVQGAKGTRGLQTGLALPLGVELAVGTGGGFPSSAGVYLNFLDLGTLVSYRWKNAEVPSTTVNTAPNASLTQVFAPGVSLMFGVSRNKPLSIGAGLQYVPRLRDTGAGTANAIRLSVFFGIDLTLFRF